MTRLDKEQVVIDLRIYCAKYKSQNAASKTLKNVSSATISQILNGKHDLISDDMWRNVAAQVRSGNAQEWHVVETRDFKVFNSLLTEAQEHSLVMAVIGPAGNGKSETMKRFAQPERNAYRLQCSEFWNRKYFLSELLTIMGRDFSGLTVGEMMQETVKHLKKQETPALLIDEADKLTDQVLYFFISFYNELEDHCAIVLSATDHLQKRIERGLKLNKKGYKEIYSRIGRKFIELKGIGSHDVAQICIANGISDKNLIQQVWEDSEGDLRRVKRKIHALKKQNNGN